jgi:putative SOS response-associated peptidase YedK
VIVVPAVVGPTPACRGSLVAVCGRYVTSRRPDDLVEDFEVDQTGDGTPGLAPGGDPADTPPDYNVAPTKAAPVVLERRPRDVGVPRELDAGPAAPAVGAVRWLRLLTWGLVPSWARDRSVGYRMINARAETLLNKPAYKRAALARRCVIPADGWYEWQKSPTETGATGKPRKQPFFVHPVAGGPIALAGVYEVWRNPAVPPDDPAAWLATYAVITTEAESGLDAIHDRMPLVLPRDRWDGWLDPELRDPGAVRALLRPPAPGRFLTTAVTDRVNAVGNNGPELIEAASVDRARARPQTLR